MATKYLLLVLGCALTTRAAIVRETLVIEEWVVDFLRPTLDVKGFFPWETDATRLKPFKITESQRGVKYMINGSYPGPTIRAFENDMLELTIVNNLFSEATTIHWHGIHPLLQPYMDGARDVTQAPIMPGQNFTYRFAAYPPGTHYYHSVRIARALGWAGWLFCCPCFAPSMLPPTGTPRVHSIWMQCREHVVFAGH